MISPLRTQHTHFSPSSSRKKQGDLDIWKRPFISHVVVVAGRRPHRRRPIPPKRNWKVPNWSATQRRNHRHNHPIIIIIQIRIYSLVRNVPRKRDERPRTTTTARRKPRRIPRMNRIPPKPLPPHKAYCPLVVVVVGVSINNNNTTNTKLTYWIGIAWWSDCTYWAFVPASPHHPKWPFLRSPNCGRPICYCHPGG